MNPVPDVIREKLFIIKFEVDKTTTDRLGVTLTSQNILFGLQHEPIFHP